MDVRPVHHRLQDRVKGHLRVFMLAASLDWHLRQARAPLCTSTGTHPATTTPSPPTKRSPGTQRKASQHTPPTTTSRIASARSSTSSPATPAMRLPPRHRYQRQYQRLAQPASTQQHTSDLLGTPAPYDPAN
jgi:hypothetical protein